MNFEEIKDHLHFIDARDGDKVCIDVIRMDGKIYSLGWYSISQNGRTQRGQADFFQGGEK
jgi:hypothetical protein